MQRKASAIVRRVPEAMEVIRPEAGENLVDSRNASVSGEITAEIMAVIETAVAAYLGKKARIVSVRLRSGSQPESSPWVGRGLDMVHGSHNVVQAQRRR